MLLGIRLWLLDPLRVMVILGFNLKAGKRLAYGGYSSLWVTRRGPSVLQSNIAQWLLGRPQRKQGCALGWDPCLGYIDYPRNASRSSVVRHIPGSSLFEADDAASKHVSRGSDLAAALSWQGASERLCDLTREMRCKGIYYGPEVLMQSREYDRSR